jgi:hypothetical protein
MSVFRAESGREIRAFQGQADADPEQELAGTGNALARAIAAAAMEAAKHIGTTHEFEVSRIQIVVDPNPGPKSYKVTITPTG